MASSTASISAVSPNAAPEPPARPVTPEPAPAPPSSETQMTRLLIQEIEGRYVYTVVDRESGRVIAQLPRQQVQEMGDLGSYSAGDVVNTRA